MARNRRKTAQTLEKFLFYPQVTGADTEYFTGGTAQVYDKGRAHHHRGGRSCVLR